MAYFARLQAAALIRMANAGDSSYDVHHPTAAQKCYTAEGAQASAAANLFLTAGNQTGVIGEPARFMDEWLIDKGIGNVGHRRFLLDPFLKKIALGLVDGEALIPVAFKPVVGAALQISHPDTNTVPAELVYVAYPEGAYPTRLFDKTGVLNFSVVPGPTREESAMVSFASATVTVSANGAALVASGVSSSNEGLGLFNNIQWRVAGLVDGVTYTVAIDGVTVKGAPKNYSYTFSLVPWPDEFAAPTQGKRVFPHKTKPKV